MENLTNISIELNQQFNTKEEAIRFCGEKLVEAGCVEPAYIEAMIERDQLLSVYMGNFIAIPHGTEEAKALILAPKKMKKLLPYYLGLPESVKNICN